MSPLTLKVLLSAILATLYGGLSYLFLLDVPDAWRWALISGLAAFSILLLMMLLREEIIMRRYRKAEKQLPPNPVFQTATNFRENRRVGSARVCLYAEEIVLLCVERKVPELTHIARHQLRTAELLSPVELRLTLMDGRVLLLLSPYMEALIHQLRQAGWPVTDKKA